MVAYFERFCLEFPREAVGDCSHQGACDGDVAHWAKRIVRPQRCSADALRSELREYGAWDEKELADDAENWLRIVWIGACNLKEEMAAH